MTKPVVVVGAGMAGLSCALELERAGVPFVLLEASERVGGKIKTDKVDGFLLDRGYQVHFEAYPNVARVLDNDALELGAFKPGAMIRDGAGFHRIEEPKDLRSLLYMATMRSVSLGDKLRVRNWTSQMKAAKVEGLRAMPDMSTERHLHGLGFSEEFMRLFLRPFMGGVFLDKSLGFSRQQFAFLWKCLSEGRTGLPKEGMEALPRAVADSLPRHSLRLYERVTSLRPSSSGDSVSVGLATHGSLEASAVVLAVDPADAGHLVDDVYPAEYNASTTVWFQSSAPPVEEPFLVLNATGSGIVNNVSPSSLAQPSYAPKGLHLVGAMIIGLREEPDDVLVPRVIEEMGRIFPDRGSSLWRPIRVDRIERAHLKEAPGFRADQPRHETRLPGVFLAGEITTNASIDGAVESGIRCARRVIAGISLADPIHA